MAFHTEYRCVEKMALGSGILPFPFKGKGEGSNQKGVQPKNPTITNNNNAFHGGGAGKRKSSNGGKALAPGS